MHLADDAKASELRLKGAPGGKTYVGPEGPPAGPQDREVVTFDGNQVRFDLMTGKTIAKKKAE